MAHARLANEGAADCYLHEMVPYQPRDKKFAPVRPATDPTYAKTLATLSLPRETNVLPTRPCAFLCRLPCLFPHRGLFPHGRHGAAFFAAKREMGLRGGGGMYTIY